jgi:GDP-mannose pyrophosphatase NudK
MSLNINVIKDKILSENWFVLRNMTYELTRSDGSVVRHSAKSTIAATAPPSAV